MARLALLALLLAGCHGGALGASCARHSDCQPGLVCSALGACAVAPADAAAFDASLIDASLIDADRIPPGPDAGDDAAIDAPPDAPPD
jgi:hypothetical protein